MSGGPDDLVLDGEIRNWVLLPIVAIMVCVTLLRTFLQQLMKGSTKPDIKQMHLKYAQVATAVAIQHPRMDQQRDLMIMHVLCAAVCCCVCRNVLFRSQKLRQNSRFVSGHAFAVRKVRRPPATLFFPFWVVAREHLMHSPLVVCRAVALAG